jgi:hypothetical protein
LILCPLYEVLLPGLHASSAINKSGYKEFLVYVTPKGEKQSTIIQSTGNGKASIEKMTFDCCEIENVEFDFDNNLCSFQSHAKIDDNIPLLLRNILSGFLIQYHPESIAFFTYRKPK